ncbi:MAG: YceI family protein [Thermomicrobiales bacterium]
MMRRYGAAIGVLTMLVLLLAACGGASTATAVPSSPASSVPAASAAGAAPSAAAPSAAAASVAVASAGAASSAVPSAAGSGSASPVAGGASGTPAASAGGSAPAAAAAEKYKIVPDKSKATYKVGENFINQGGQYNLAEGTTGDVNGELAIDRSNPSKSTIGEIKVDISKLESDSGRRDDMIRGDWLQSNKYPIATFKTKRLEGLPTTAYADGTELKFKIIGDMTIHNTTKELTFEATAKIVNGVLTGTAVAKFNMTDFGFDPPSILGILKAENAVELTMTIEANRQP